MITVTNRDTCRDAYIDETLIQHMEELQDEMGGRAYPFTRVFLKDEKQKHDYFLDVVQSKARIEKLIAEKTS